MTELCPCQSGEPFTGCCKPIHDGRPALTPEALMRSRYTAYAIGDARHLIRTTDPVGRHFRTDRGTWRAELEAYCGAVEFIGLEVLSSGVDGATGQVHFRATFRQGVEVRVQEERSRFRRKGRSWVYTDAE